MKREMSSTVDASQASIKMSEYDSDDEILQKQEECAIGDVTIEEDSRGYTFRSCHTTKSGNGTGCRHSRSTYLYERNPLQDLRFTRLIELLVPLRNQLQVEKKNKLDSKKTLFPRDEICFKDICLNETCRLVFKIMSKGNENGEAQR